MAEVIEGPLIEMFCANCGFRCAMSVEFYIEMMKEMIEAEGENAQPKQPSD